MTYNGRMHMHLYDSVDARSKYIECAFISVLVSTEKTKSTEVLNPRRADIRTRTRQECTLEAKLLAFLLGSPHELWCYLTIVLLLL